MSRSRTSGICELDSHELTSDANLALKDGRIVDWSIPDLMELLVSRVVRTTTRTHGFTVTPIAKPLTVGASPLSGGG